MFEEDYDEERIWKIKRKVGKYIEKNYKNNPNLDESSNILLKICMILNLRDIFLDRLGHFFEKNPSVKKEFIDFLKKQRKFEITSLFV